MAKELINKIILLVDDSETDAFLLQHEFMRAGFQNSVIRLSTGEQAIAYLKGTGQYADRNSSPLPSIIMLDLIMPGIGGLQVLEWIRAQPGLTNLLIVVLTGMEDAKSVQRASSLGVNLYLTKPANSDDIEKLGKFFKNYWMTADPVARGEAFSGSKEAR